jgi:hypothetical protein
MKKRLWKWLIGGSVAFVLHVGNALGIEVNFTSIVKWVYPLSDGSFVLTFNTTDLTVCPGTVVPDYYHVITGQNGITVEGSKKIYSAAMLAFSLSKPVIVFFDNATTNCYVNRVIVTN